jgi:hydrogenase maturation protein HypF
MNRHRIDAPGSGEGGGRRAMKRMRVVLRGAVQGVGFRPFVYKLAGRLGLNGWVSNTGAGVVIEVEGEEGLLQDFLLRLEEERPARSFIQSLEHSMLDPAGARGFTIRESAAGGVPSALVLPDIATCPDCVAELFDPQNRRYRYPFINCTHCGPRFSIITGLPYDRPRTSMAGFDMCAACRHEYDDPEDRRFHAQPIACPTCGPRITLLSPYGLHGGSADDAVRAAAATLREGGILALKGIGGFQLLVDARNSEAIRRLRTRKRREEKPFAVMMPTAEAVRRVCHLSAHEERLLASSEAPIVLLARQTDDGEICTDTAPGNPALGVMLPYSPLHHLLMRELGFAVVATSGNISDEPICTDEHEALSRLSGIADIFLVHNRPIVRHVDDSIVRVIAGRELILRRARGYAPLPVRLPISSSKRILSVGAHLKNSIGLLSGQDAFLSQHIGDLESTQADTAFHSVVSDLQGMYGNAEEIVCDLHPDYRSTLFARASGLPVTAVQHHYAHVLACMAENELEGPVLGVSWDGTGLGTDGTIWGGEFLIARGPAFRRAAAFRPFRLPGGDRGVKEPRRAALGILYEMSGERAIEQLPDPLHAGFSEGELGVLQKMLRSGLNSALTSSAGRLFDGAAALLGLRLVSTFEGQAAMELEFAAARSGTTQAVELPLSRERESPSLAENRVQKKETTGHITIDWAPLFEHILKGIRREESKHDLAAVFQNSLAHCIVSTALAVGIERVVLSGGCFQNKALTEKAIEGLKQAGFRVYWHQRVSPNDGGIALGQLYAAVLSSRPEGANQEETSAQ